MCDEARDISRATFLKHCDAQDVIKGMGYSIGPEKGLHLKDDYHVSYHKSRYRGKPCYFMCWSAIEYIFV